MDWAYWSVTAGMKGVFLPTGDGTYGVTLLVSACPVSRVDQRTYAERIVSSSLSQTLLFLC